MIQTNFMEKWSVFAVLRFLLASIVAVNHMPDYVPIGAWAVIPMFGAFEAILGFLLISGYSIGASYRKEPSNFLWRRVKRIYPIYLAALAMIYVVHVVEKTPFPPSWELGANLLFLNQVVTSTSLVGPAWSLSLEFWLYSLTPLLFRLSDKALHRTILGSFAAYCLYTCGRTLFHWNYYSGTAFGLNLLLLSFVWLAGMKLARDPAESKRTLTLVGGLFAAHMALTAAIQGAFRIKNGALPVFFQVDLPELALRTTTLVVVVWLFARVLRAEEAEVGRARPSSWMRILGDISYPLYLIHIPIFIFMKRAGFTSPLVFFLASMAGAALLYRVLDLYSQRRHGVVKPAHAKKDMDLPRAAPD